MYLYKLWNQDDFTISNCVPLHFSQNVCTTLRSMIGIYPLIKVLSFTLYRLKSVYAQWQIMETMLMYNGKLHVYIVSTIVDKLGRFDFIEK